MALKFSDRLFDYGLDVLDLEADRVDICSTEPDTYAEATSTYSLGYKAITRGSVCGSPGNGTPSGRKSTMAAVVGGSVTGTGTAAYLAISDTTNSRLLATAPLDDSYSVVKDNLFGLTAIDFTFLDPINYWTISGNILDDGDDPLVGVTVSDGTRSDETDASGDYTIVDVPDGTYEITPTLTDYEFTPASEEDVTVGPNQTDIDFVGTAGNITTFEETWDSATDGDYFSGNITNADKTWSISGSDPYRKVIVANDYIEFYNNAGSSSTQITCSSLGTTLSDTDFIFKAKVNGPARYGDFYLYDDDYSDIPLYARVHLDTGVLTVNGNNCGAAVTKNTWFDLKVRVDYDNEKVSVWVNDTLEADAVAWDTIGASDKVTKVNFRLANGSEGDHFYVDTITIGQGLW